MSQPIHPETPLRPSFFVKLGYMKVRQSQAYYGVLNSSKKRTKLTILSREDAQDNELGSFFGRSYGSTILF